MWLTYYQGEVYAKVIVEVCKQSRPDFEDGGVDESVLDLLRSVRCSLHNFFICAIATFHDDHIINQERGGHCPNPSVSKASHIFWRWWVEATVMSTACGKAAVGRGSGRFWRERPSFDSFLYPPWLPNFWPSSNHTTLVSPLLTPFGHTRIRHLEY